LKFIKKKIHIHHCGSPRIEPTTVGYGGNTSDRRPTAVRPPPTVGSRVWAPRHLTTTRQMLSSWATAIGPNRRGGRRQPPLLVCRIS
jgi:hypothetical protein